MTNTNPSAQASAPLLLIVDETRITADIDKTFFLEAGFRVTIAASTVEIVNTVSEQCVDLMLIDVDFSKGQGLSILSKVKHSSKNPDLKVLATSVVGSPEVRAAAQKSGANSFLAKPAPRQKILNEVKALTSLAVRDAERIQQSLVVDLSWDGRSLKAVSLDVSEDGIHLSASHDTPDVGVRLGMRIHLENNFVVEVEGKVVRHTKEGFGVRFFELARNSKRELDKFLLEHSMESRASQYYL